MCYKEIIIGLLLFFKHLIVVGYYCNLREKLDVSLKK